MKIPLRIIFLLAPWCFVWLIAIGCSQQGSGSSETISEPVKPREIVAVELENTALPTSVEGMLARYSMITQSRWDPLRLRRELGKFYMQWGKSAGEAAVLHAFEQNRTLLPEAFAGWIQLDGDEPYRWVLAQVDRGRSKRKACLAAGLLHSLPPDSHEERSRWVTRVAGLAGCDELVAEVATNWGIEYPQQALDWLEAIAESRVKPAVVEEIFHHWVERDPGMAAARLTQMPAGIAKDRVISSLAKAIDRDDPETARLWAGSIVDEGLRQITSSLLSETLAAADQRISGLLSQAE